MVVTCPSCAARYRLAPEKIQGRGAKITCPKCSHVFVVFAEGGGDDEGKPPASPAEGAKARDQATTTGAFKAVGLEPPTGAGAGASTGSIKVVAPGPRGKRSRADTGQMEALRADGSEGSRGGAESSQPSATVPAPASKEDEPRSAAALDFREVGIQTWKVKVAIGLIYDFSDIATLKKYLADKKVTPKDLLSPNGKDWTCIEDIPDLDQHFIKVWKDAKAAQASGAAPAPKPKKLTSDALSSGAIPSVATSSLSTSALDLAGSSGSARTVGAIATGERVKAKAASKPSNRREAAPVEPEGRRGLLVAAAALLLIGAGAWFALSSRTPRAPVVDIAPAGRSLKPPEKGPTEQESVEDKIRERIDSVTPEPVAEDDEPAEERLVPVRPSNPLPPPRPQSADLVPAVVQKVATPAAPTPAPAVSPPPTERTGGARLFLDAGRKKLAEGNFASAEAMLKKAVGMEPDCKDCWESLAEAYQKLGNADESARAREKANGLATQNASGRP